jgi:TRAP-type mannitol/chloroaromatic compound transport system permease small subunit
VVAVETLRRAVAGVGRLVSWLTLAMVLVTFAVVLLRYGFNLGWIWLQESVTYLHATVFMLAAAWALQDDGHVRVDVFYRDRSERHKAWVNLAGTGLFLVPLCVFFLASSWEYVLRSWQVMEGSREAGGLPLVFLLKSLILLLPALLLMQSVCQLVDAFRLLRGRDFPGVNLDA